MDGEGDGSDDRNGRRREAHQSHCVFLQLQRCVYESQPQCRVPPLVADVSHRSSSGHGDGSGSRYVRCAFLGVAAMGFRVLLRLNHGGCGCGCDCLSATTAMGLIGKDKGGLGIPKSRERNLVFLTSLFWRAREEGDKVWAKVYSNRLSLKSGKGSVLGKCLRLGSEWADKVWYCAAPQFTLTQSNDIRTWIKRNSSSTSQVQFQVPHGTLFIYIIQQIWLCRNNLIFNARDFNVSFCFKSALSKAAEYSHLTGINGVVLLKEPVFIKWQPPPHGWWKVNIDGSCLNSSNDIVAGGVIRDQYGNRILDFAKYLGGGSILCAELWAIAIGLDLAKRAEGERIIVESNSMATINLINDTNMNPFHHLSPILSRCRSYLVQFDEVVFIHKFREANQVAEALAKHGVQSKCDLTCFQIAPAFLTSLFWSDYFGFSCQRGSSFFSVDAG
ncbi:putative ribonuclease h protein [Senna tora]|uniref:Putative ribonuclease h protein n=1 Tax=Senna tora TaxID=362788 RepID=A0A834WD47_9FABA|nr:putative ribonuclease h protein [Senna tora]